MPGKSYVPSKNPSSRVVRIPRDQKYQMRWVEKVLGPYFNCDGYDSDDDKHVLKGLTSRAYTRDTMNRVYVEEEARKDKSMSPFPWWIRYRIARVEFSVTAFGNRVLSDNGMALMRRYKKLLKSGKSEKSDTAVQFWKRIMDNFGEPEDEKSEAESDTTECVPRQPRKRARHNVRFSSLQYIGSMRAHL